MRCQGIRGASRTKKRFTTKSDPNHVRAPDLVNRNFCASRPDELWVCDFTYCSTWTGIVYVAFVVDVFSRRLVGWKAARSMTTTLVLDALNMAAWSRRHSDLAGVTCHSDAGSQYTSIAYTERLDDIGAAPSIGTIGDCPLTGQYSIGSSSRPMDAVDTGDKRLGKSTAFPSCFRQARHGLLMSHGHRPACRTRG